MWISATLAATRVWSKVRAAKSDNNCLLLGIAPNIRIHAVTVTRSLPSTWLLHPRLMRLLRLLSLRCDCCVGALVHQCGLLAMSKPVRAWPSESKGLLLLSYRRRETVVCIKKTATNGGSTNRIPILILFLLWETILTTVSTVAPRLCQSGRWRSVEQESK